MRAHRRWAVSFLALSLLLALAAPPLAAQTVDEVIKRGKVIVGVNTTTPMLDLALHDMDGHEVLRRLKADPATREIPVILKTAVHVEDGHRQRGLEAGAAGYFADPFDPQALIGAVRGVLRDGAS